MPSGRQSFGYNDFMTEENKIGFNIKKFRQATGLSQDKFAKQANISCSALIKLETGIITNPNILTLQKIVGVLGISVNDLLA
ncbi:MAG: helix-turn-helix transcriptional regulator [Candidatus Pacebacteria bacterium]|nr:helix-turn-helix transcriptional regulator [Candidatus Paceibacterota bacterium]